MYAEKQNELLNEWVSSMDSLDSTFDKEVEQKMFAQLKGVDGFLEWINYIMEIDIKNHYSAITDVQRAHIRGGQSRLLDMKKRMLTSEKVLQTRISGVKYGH